ncbi:MAG: hypothetical protein L0Z62_45050 [Gemmataceae bacterium]|nr:hypothetical protein [Gemmataceae bacterium]
MAYRAISLLLVVVALTVFAGPPAWSAGEKPHEGKVVKAGDGKLTMTFKGDDKKHTHDVAKDAKIILDDKKAKLEDLKEGYHVNVWMDTKHVVTKIEAHSKAK